MRSIELYEEEELLLARSELMRRVVCGPRDVDNRTDWNSSQRRLKRRDGPSRGKKETSITEGILILQQNESRRGKLTPNFNSHPKHLVKCTRTENYFVLKTLKLPQNMVMMLGKTPITELSSLGATA